MGKELFVLIFAASVVVAMILLIVTVLLIVNAVKKKNNYSVCRGVITGFHENRSEAVLGDYEDSSVAPIVQYTVNGKTYEIIGRYYSTSMKIGKQVDVLYNPSNASIATLKTGVNIAPIITGALCAVFFIISVLLFLLRATGVI